MSAPAPLSEVLDLLDLELLYREGEQAEDKVCHFAGHEPAVKAISECICLACAQFCGNACAEHERWLIAIMEKNSRGHRIRCKHCGTFNNVTFVPLPA